MHFEQPTTETRGMMLSTVWTFVVINIIVADIVGFLNPGALEAIMTGAVGFELTQELMLVFAVLFQVPIALILRQLERTRAFQLQRQIAPPAAVPVGWPRRDGQAPKASE